MSVNEIEALREQLKRLEADMRALEEVATSVRSTLADIAENGEGADHPFTSQTEAARLLAIIDAPNPGKVAAESPEEDAEVDEEQELRDWVLAVHESEPQEDATLGDDPHPETFVRSGIWWVVLDKEDKRRVDQEVDSIWPTKSEAVERVEELGIDWEARPAVLSLWGRDAEPPEGEPISKARRRAEARTDSPVLSAVLRALKRDCGVAKEALAPYLPRVATSRGTAEHERRRVWMALDWMTRTFAPEWLEQAGMTEEAAALRGLPEVADAMALGYANVPLKAARSRTLALAAANWPTSVEEAAAKLTNHDSASLSVWAAVGAPHGLGEPYTSGMWDVERSNAARMAADAALHSAAHAVSTGVPTSTLEATAARLRQSVFELLERMLRVTG